MDYLITEALRGLDCTERHRAQRARLSRTLRTFATNRGTPSPPPDAPARGANEGPYLINGYVLTRLRVSTYPSA